MKRFSESINHAVDGIIYAFKTERNLKIHFVATLAVLLAALVLDLTKLEIVMIFFAIALVMVAEMFNTAMEAFVDLLTLSHHPLARIAKDVAAGSVLIATINALAVSYLILFSAMKRPLLMAVLRRVRESWVHLPIIIFAITIIGVVVGKALGGKGKFMQGGLVSGHAAVAFGVSTAILLMTKNILATSLAFFLALLVAQSRIEAKFHKWFEVVLGALLGISVSLLIYYVFYQL
ncbi:MAG: diacylglycerol kinase [Vulcanimicrobiota bacterium]